MPLTPPNASTANADSLAEKTALQAAANTAFITYATEAIANATAQGKYWVTLTTFEYCNVVNLHTYFMGLGYAVFFPDSTNPNVNPLNPAELFGTSYDAYWADGGGIGWFNFKAPLRIRIEWKVVGLTY